MPTEFQPDANRGYLASLLAPIGQQEEEGIGRSGSIDGVSSASAGSRIGTVEAGASRARTGTIAKFNTGLAGMDADERKAAEEMAFKTKVAQENRDFEAEMQRGEENFSRGERNAEDRASMIAAEQGQVSGMHHAFGQLAASMYCDRRLKKNIRLIGHTGPFAVYAFEYRQDMGVELPTGPRVGPMADEVEAICPAAVSVEANGYKKVDMARLQGAF